MSRREDHESETKRTTPAVGWRLPQSVRRLVRRWLRVSSLRGVQGAALGGCLLAAPAAAHARAYGLAADVPSATHERPRAKVHVASVRYGGGPVLHSNRTHLVFWSPAGSGLLFDAGYQAVIETFLARVAADSHRPGSVYGLTGQYRDSRGAAAYASAYAGAIIATDPLPGSGCREPPPPPAGGGPGWTVCLSDTQIQRELAHVIAAHQLPRGGNNIYFLVTPDGLGSCLGAGPEECAVGGQAAGGYCGYHSQSSDGTLYAVIAYNAVPGHCQSGNPRPNSSPADPTINTLSEEQTETITDPFGDGWIDSAGNELGDICATTYGPNLNRSRGRTAYDQTIHGGHYMLHEFWSNEDRSCRAADEHDRISARVPAIIRAGRPVDISASARDPDGAIVRFDWFFGDGHTAHGRRVRHAFRKTGRVTVLVRSTDAAGNYAFAKRRLRVLRAPAGRSRT